MNIQTTQKSFVYALRGMRRAWREEQNFRIHVLVAVMIIIFAVLRRISATAGALLALAISMVLALELVNTALERLSDTLSPRIHPFMGAVKDIMAAAVLISSLGAVVVGVLVFGFL